MADAAISTRVTGLPLWLKLTAAAVCLTGAAAAAVGVAGFSLARHYLIRQAGWQAQADAQRLLGQALMAGHTPTPVPGGVGAGGVSVEMLGPAGQRLLPVGRGAGTGPVIPAGSGWLAAHAGRPVTVPGRGGQDWRVVAEPVHYQARHLPFVFGADDFALVPSGPAGPGPRGTLVVAVGLGPAGRAARRLAVAALAIGGAVTAALAGMAAMFLRASFRPLEALAESARAVVARGSPGPLVGVSPRGEAGRIARPLNLMLSRVAVAARALAEREAAARRREERMRQGVVDACHGLRESLAVIGASADYCRRGRQAPGGLDRVITGVDEEASRMAAIAGALRVTAEAAQDRPGTGHTGQAGRAP